MTITVFRTTVERVYMECEVEWDKGDESVGQGEYFSVLSVKVGGVDIINLLGDDILDSILFNFKTQPGDDD